MTDYDVIFSAFDPKTGPFVIYSSLDSIDIAKKIAMKSFIAIGAMEDATDIESKYAVLPLPNYQKNAFYYMFRIKMKDSDEYLLATIANIQDSKTTIDFYRTLSLLQQSVSSAVNFIQKSYLFEGKDSKIDSTIVTVLDSLKTITPVKEIPLKIQQPSGLTYEDFKEGDLPFLFEYFSQDLDKVIHSLLLEEPVLVIGNIKDLIQKVVSSLTMLVPHRFLMKEYIMNYTDPKSKDILICSPHVNFLKKYKNITNVHVESRKITSKVHNLPSIGNLIHTLSIAPKETQELVVKQYIDKLLGKTAQLMELCEREQMAKEEIQNFRRDLNYDELNIVISMVRNYAPQFESKLFYFARSLI
jgi:hypothetical protein